MKTIFVGTNKGLFRLREGHNGNWNNTLFNKGQSVYAVGGDAQKVSAAPFTEWTGTNLLFSTDLGETWIDTEKNLLFPEGKLRVYRTNDSGETFTPLSSGLPQDNVFDSVLRDCLDSTDENICFGTCGGKVFLSQNDGENWSLVADNLPRITCIRIFES